MIKQTEIPKIFEHIALDEEEYFGGVLTNSLEASNLTSEHNRTSRTSEGKPNDNNEERLSL